MCTLLFVFLADERKNITQHKIKREEKKAMSYTGYHIVFFSVEIKLLANLLFLNTWYLLQERGSIYHLGQLQQVKGLVSCKSLCRITRYVS